MEALLYFVIWGALIFFMMRFGCGAHIMGHNASSAGPEGPGVNGEGAGGQRRIGDAAATHGTLRWVPPETDTDPVCGKTISTEKARPSVHAGNVYYFCTRECREVFEAAPDLYVGDGADGGTGAGGGDSRKLEHSNA